MSNPSLMAEQRSQKLQASLKSRLGRASEALKSLARHHCAVKSAAQAWVSINFLRPSCSVRMI